MWGISMPMGIQNLLENIIQHLPQSNYAIFKNEIVTHFEIESSMLTEFHSIKNWVWNFFKKGLNSKLSPKFLFKKALNLKLSPKFLFKIFFYKILKELTKNDHKSLNHIQIHNLGHFPLEFNKSMCVCHHYSHN